MGWVRRLFGGDGAGAGNDGRPLPPMPPVATNAEGKPRRIGIEIEFSGLDLDGIMAVVADRLGGEPRRISDYEGEVECPHTGTWRVELDNAYLKRLGREHAEHEDEGDDDAAGLPEALMALVARRIVPFEVVSPPLPLERLSLAMSVVQALAASGARGTRHAPLYAFGLHLNPEMSALDAGSIRRHMQAYAFTQEWLRRRCDVDFSRRLTPYIDPWPKRWLRRLAQPDYRPELPELIDDYLEHNPTRNRALDMLPLFAHLDETRVRAAVDDDRIKARPTLHYRLPNSQIDEPGWNIGVAWRDWLQVEWLAADAQRLSAVQTAFCEHLSSITGRLLEDWPDRLAREFLLPELF